VFNSPDVASRFEAARKLRLDAAGNCSNPGSAPLIRLVRAVLGLLG